MRNREGPDGTVQLMNRADKISWNVLEARGLAVTSHDVLGAAIDLPTEETAPVLNTGAEVGRDAI